MTSAFASTSVLPQSSSLVDLAVLQQASSELNNVFGNDNGIVPDQDQVLPFGQSSSSYSVFADDSRVPFQKRKLLGIPDALFQHYNNASTNSRMGILPEVERVWIVMDNVLILWDYNEGQEISTFNDQPNVITHVALVKPKKALLVDEISHLLVVCTPLTILLIGVSLTPVPGTRKKNILLWSTDLMLTTDIEMESVVGTPDGRIFMCGAHDGNLYELHYQSTESWFGKRIQLVNHSVGGMSSLIPRFASSGIEDRIVYIKSDDVRGIIYTLTEKSNISAYRPTTDKSVQHEFTISGIYNKVQDRAPGSPALSPQKFQIISVHPVSPAESDRIWFVAITSTGVRLYYGQTATYGAFNGAPSLIHVRLPPTNVPHPDVQEQPYRPTGAYGLPSSQPIAQSKPCIVTDLDNTSYVDGLSVLAQPGDVDGRDFILCMSPDLTRIGSLGQNIPQAQPSGYYQPSRPPLTEYASVLAIPGRTWAMAAVPKDSAYLFSAQKAPCATNELASQFIEYPRQFMLLTDVGLTFLVKRRAMDYLKAVLEDWYADGEVAPMVEFRDSFGRNQTCAMLLGLASNNSFLAPSDDAPSGALSPDILNLVKQAFYDLGERPVYPNTSAWQPQATDNKKIVFSGRKEGFSIYFARLVRPIWKTKIITPGAGPAIFLPTAPENLIVTIQKNLAGLKDFLDQNPHMFHMMPTGANGSSVSPEMDAWKAEQEEVNRLTSLLTRTIEALSFLLLLMDYNLTVLVSKCEPRIQQLLASQTFEALITARDGMEVSSALVNVVIDQQIGQQLSVDAISEILQQRCGSFCSADDVRLYKAKEDINKAVETRNINEREALLSNSLESYIKAARVLDIDKLSRIVGDYQKLAYAKGAIELPLACANVFDPDNAGLAYWAAGMPANDNRQEFWNRREACYSLVLHSISEFEASSSSGQANPLAMADPDSVRSHAYDYAFASTDEPFHSQLYEWLIDERKVADELLEIRPAFLEMHLMREPATTRKYQLLWQFYVKAGQPLRAAQVLSAMAQSSDFKLHIEERLEFLTLAVSNAKSHPVSGARGNESAVEFLMELEDRLDVAKVQLEVFNILRPIAHEKEHEGPVRDTILQLDQRLFDLSELFTNYGVAFGSAEIKLLCIYVSGHQDESMVREIWKQIFSECTEGVDAQTQAEVLLAKVVSLGQKFFPSESAFPLRIVAELLARFTLDHLDILPYGWTPRILIQCGVPYFEIWDILNGMYESHIPPFNAQVNVQRISGDIAMLLQDWLEEARRPNSKIGRDEVPAGRVDVAVDKYLAELGTDKTDVKQAYENTKRMLRRNW
ncbi:nucleoporin [Cylindrobasidium torrendii FP15055 ss-10]|uniref:Nucleoporin n=1 Tax=Cylindrobasidium torrendii FP15055 ss-10 TaxID=1314674 RepID=A0A0D7B3F2_9AGAR|nr:nucleoporin [Cylindrobasidium torrendii FP15055 ss-10]